MQCYIITPWLLPFYIFFIYFYFCSLPNFVFYFSFALRLVLQRILFVVCFFFSLVSFFADIFRISLYSVRCAKFHIFLILVIHVALPFFPSRLSLSTHFSCKIPCITNFYISSSGFRWSLFSFFFFNRELVCFKLKCYAIFVSTV